MRSVSTGTSVGYVGAAAACQTLYDRSWCEAAIRNFGEQLLEHRMNNEFASAIAAVSLTAVRSVEIARSVPNVSTMHAALSIPFVRWDRDEPRRESGDA
jgi:hypothetical protein